MSAVLGEQGDRIEAGAVVMELALEALDLAAVDEIPVAAGAAVVAPAGDDGIVGEDGVEGDVGFVFIAEVSGPVVDLFLAGGVPRHLATEGVRLTFPPVGSKTHQRFELRGLFGATLVFQILKQAQEDGALHLAETRVVRRLGAHSECGFVCLIEVPLPRMFGDKSLRVAREPIEGPIGGDDVRIVVGAADVAGALDIPACPTLPVKVGIVVVGWHSVWLVVEETLVYAVFVIAGTFL